MQPSTHGSDELSSQSTVRSKSNRASFRSWTFNTKRNNRNKSYALGRRNVKKPRKSRAVLNDLSDYEQKYPPDREHEEMGPYSRLFKTYMDEAEKHDLELVDSWREGLDMLLVFAALFSAVVTTFVTQTFQSLRVDNTDVAVSLIGELVDIGHALVTGSEIDIHSTPATPPPFRPKTTDLWVNGLWFTSLGFSLSTSLLAIVTKQWIHQYLSIPSGNPRSCARVRQFRFDALKKWRVPLIIELLPVLMHMSLGLFSIGLVVFLYGLSGIIALDLGLICGSTFLVYSISNALPIFFVDCSYKTPLSMYTFSIITYIRRSISPKLAAMSIPSLKDIELDIVERLGNLLDASCMTWLYNSSSNDTVQSVVLQGLSSLPLESIPLIDRAEPRGIPSVLEAIEADFYPGQTVDRFERLKRAAIRFKDSNKNIVIYSTCAEPSKYTRYCIPQNAITLIETNLTGLSTLETNFDVVLWAEIFTNAMEYGTGWLQISRDEPSRVWSELLAFAVGSHDCKLSNCRKAPERERSLLTFPCKSLPGYPPLVINDYDLQQNGTNPTLGMALAQNMYPSFIEWILHAGFSHFVPSATDYTENLPRDLVLLLAMVQTPSIQKTSSVHSQWEDDDDDDFNSLFSQLLMILEIYSTGTGVSRCDKLCNVDKATVIALVNVIKSDHFGESTDVTVDDKVLLVTSAFNGLNRQLLLPTTRTHSFSWLTPKTMRHVISAAFSSPKVGPGRVYKTISNIISYLLCSPSYLVGTELLYANLIERDWLAGLAMSIKNAPDPSFAHGRDTDHAIDPLYAWDPRYTAVLAASYVDGLPSLASHSPQIYGHVMENLTRPANLATMCKILLASDIDSQARLWKLAQFVQVDLNQWSPVIEEVVEFAASKRGKGMHGTSRSTLAIGVGGKIARNVMPSMLEFVAAQFTLDVGHRSYSPPNYLDTEV